MKRPAVIYSLFQWFRSSELFARPSKQLPGKWKLFEYYIEPAGKLINMKEEQIQKEKQYWELNFEPHGQVGQSTNLPVKFLNGTSSCIWQTSRNFITLIHSDDSNQKVEFQFAVVKGKLKLLKKNTSGKIEFFGFFKKIEKPEKEQVLAHGAN